jgi:alkylphosphonate utilization operon protein PhnA
MRNGPSIKARASPISCKNYAGMMVMDVKDSNGAILKDGDNVSLIKDLKVKGSSTTLKRGTMIKGIRLTGDPDEIDCRHEKIKGLVLRTEFVKKA